MRKVTASVDLGRAPAEEARRRLERMLDLGWIPERVVLSKPFAAGVGQDAAEDELREAMGEHWVEARLA